MKLICAMLSALCRPIVLIASLLRFLWERSHRLYYGRQRNGTEYRDQTVAQAVQPDDRNLENHCSDKVEKPTENKECACETEFSSNKSSECFFYNVLLSW